MYYHRGVLVSQHCNNLHVSRILIFQTKQVNLSFLKKFHGLPKKQKHLLRILTNLPVTYKNGASFGVIIFYVAAIFFLHLMKSLYRLFHF